MDDSNPRNQGPAPRSEREPIDRLVDALREAKSSDDMQASVQNFASNWTAGATVAMAIFTFVSLGIGILQWRIQSRTLDEMQDEQRAWIIAPEVKISYSNDRTNFVIEFKNSGKRAAKKFFVDGKVVSGKSAGNSGRFIWQVEVARECARAIELSREVSNDTYLIPPDGIFRATATPSMNESYHPPEITYGNPIEIDRKKWNELVDSSDPKAVNYPHLAGCATYFLGDDNAPRRIGYDIPLTYRDGKIKAIGSYTVEAD